MTKRLMTTPQLQSLDKRPLPAAVDPDGTHVVVVSMLHNDIEVRALVLVKIKDQMEPVEVWVDVPLAYFNRLPVFP